MRLLKILSLQFVAMFSLNLWATPSVSPACEILMQNSYGKMIRRLGINKVLSIAEIRELIRQDQPTNPFHAKEKNPDRISFRAAIDREMKRKVTLASWPEIKTALARLADYLAGREVSEELAKDDTRGILNPRFFAHVDTSDYKFKFNSSTNEFIAWKTHFNPEVTGTPYYRFNLETQEKIDGTLDRNATIFIRRNGEVWTAGTNEKHGIVVRPLSSKSPHVTLPKNGDVQLDLFETASGRLILANSTTQNGIFVYDISDKSNVKTLLESSADKHRLSAVFYESPRSEVYLVSAASKETNVYKLTEDSFTFVGKIKHISDTQNNNTIITTDPDENVILGHAIQTKNGFKVVKIESGIEREVFARSDLDGLPHSAFFRWNGEGQLLLTLSRSWDKNIVQTVNVFEQSQPEIKIPVVSHLELRPSWFKLPNGQEVLAISPLGGRPFIADAVTGAILWTASLVGNLNQAPVWAQATDGKIYLAFEATSGMHIFEVWRGDCAGETR